jgi:prepilin-type processing-associated H-X9-DG protein
MDKTKPVSPFVGSQYDGPFNQNVAYKFEDMVDGTSNTAAIGERYRTDQSNGDANTGGWGYWAVGAGDAQDGNAQWSGTTGLPFNVIMSMPPANNADRKVMYAGFRSRHSGGCNFVFLDGSVHFLTDATSDDARMAIGTRAGGEVFNLDQ